MARVERIGRGSGEEGMLRGERQVSLREAAEAAARAAGHELVRRFKHSRDVRWKTYRGERTVVTDADLAADAAIRAVLKACFPDSVVLSEEFPHDEIMAPDMWVVDPLDGTDNYARSQPQFCVSVAHASRGVVDVGAVYDPVRDEMFAATASGPATLNETTIRVSARDDPGQCAVAWAQRGVSPEDSRRFHGALGAAAERFQRVRMTGSAALEMGWVAAGRYDGALFSNVKWWDHAAGSLIVTRAGGRATDLFGRPVGPHCRRCVYSNGRLHDAIVGLAREHGLHEAFRPGGGLTGQPGGC